MNTQTQESYLKRIERVQAYISNHLDEDIDLNILADVACFSHYHFHRIYHGVIGETVMQTVRRMRMHRAAGDLIRSSTDIAAIAKRAGYNSIEAFSRAFKSSYGTAPASYRVQTQDTPIFVTKQKMSTGMFDVEIKTLEPLKLAAVFHQGDYMDVGNAFNKAAMWAAKHNLLDEQTLSIGVYYDDPKAVAQEDLRADAGFVVDQNYNDEEAGIRTIDLAGGRYAVLRFKGPYAELEKAYHWFFGAWLSQSGEEAGDQPPFECYLNDPKTTPPTELLTEIHMALK